MKKIDELDENIIRFVQNPNMCTPKVSAIAKALKLPTSTIHSRLKKLESSGVITGYHASVDAEKIGKPLTVFALVKLKYPENPGEIEFDELVAEKIASSSNQIEEVHAMTGDWELLVKIRAKDSKDYYRISKECILPAGRIIKVHGLMAVKTIKEQHTIAP